MSSSGEPSDMPVAGPRTITLQIPEGAEVGDVLGFVINGKELEIPIPEGSQPGDVLEIQVDADADADADADGGNNSQDKEDIKEADDVDETDVTLELPGNKRLHFSTALPPTERASSAEGDPNTADENLNSFSDGTHAHPWPAGIFMSKFWGTPEASRLMVSLVSTCTTNDDSATQTQTNSNDKEQQQHVLKDGSATKLRVLELGSGLGMVGMAFCAHYCWKITQNADLGLPALGHVVLSDVPEGMALLRHNLQQNRAHLGLNDDTKLQACPLVWNMTKLKNSPFEKTNDSNHHPYLLLGSDLLYNTDSIPALVSTIQQYFASSAAINSALILAVRWRKPDLERAFFQALEGWHGKHWHLVATAHCPLSWKDYGNPNCDASNRYFYQTMIAVQGTPYSLADILLSEQEGNDSDDDYNNINNTNDKNKPRRLAELMNDREAEAFENCHIQIYCLSNVPPALDEDEESKAETKCSVPTSRKRTLPPLTKTNSTPGQETDNNQQNATAESTTQATNPSSSKQNSNLDQSLENSKSSVSNDESTNGGKENNRNLTSSTHNNITKRASARWAILRNAIVKSSQQRTSQGDKEPIPPKKAPTKTAAAEGSIHRFSGFGLLLRQRLPRNKMTLLLDWLTNIALNDQDQQDLNGDNNLVDALESSLLALSALRPDQWVWEFSVHVTPDTECLVTKFRDNPETMLEQVDERLQSNLNDPKQRLRLQKEQCGWMEEQSVGNNSSAGITSLTSVWKLKIVLAPFYPSHGIFQYTLPSFDDKVNGKPQTNREETKDELVLYTRERLAIAPTSLQELTSHHRNQGVDNTGNICVWDSEQTLAFSLLKNLKSHSDFPILSPTLGSTVAENCTSEIAGQGALDEISILELGSGMAGLSGLSLVQMLQRQQRYSKIRLWLTDGHPQAVQNNKVHAYLMRLQMSCANYANDSNSCETKVKCLVLPWSMEPPPKDSTTKEQLVGPPSPCHVALVSDCTHFQEFHAHLFFTLAYGVRVNGCVYMCQPHRGRSLERFLDVVRATSLGGDNRPPVFSIEWVENVSEVKNSIESSAATAPHYDPNIHCPYLILLRKLRQVTEQDHQLVAEHMRARDRLV